MTATVALAAVLVGLAFGGLRYYASALARSWGSQLPDAPEDRIEGILRCIARLGEPGIPVLVQALGSDRDAVGFWAKEVIQEEIISWKNLPFEQAARRLSAAADALATQTQQFAPDGRSRAADLAACILRGRADNEPALPDRVVAACERVLWAEAADREAEARRRPWPTFAVAGIDEPPMEAAPLPPALADRPVSPPSANPSQPGEPAPSPASSPEHPSFQSAEPSPANSDVGEAEAASEAEGNSLANKPGNVRSVSLAGSAEALPPAAGASTADRGWSETAEILRRLHSDDPRAADDARTQLARRGLTPAEQEVAKRIFHPDAAVRKQLARALPGMPGLDAAPWLLQLAADQDAEVRLAAITLLLTTGDPALVARARRTADADPDPRIREQAERMGAGTSREKGRAGTPRP